ncbi:hypothetical protein [Sorangium sp. So ce394]|uniref:hypothetical protein n=1 Tax=Sorangium sp. So ce394 TaxID=3133310 RepID=UPI003F5BE2F7
MDHNDPPDLYLQLLLNVLYKYMTNPATDFYLPKLVAGQTNPTYEPYVIDGEWSLAGAEELRTGGSMICFSTLPESMSGEYNQGIASVAPHLSFAGPSRIRFDGAIPFQVRGLSNVQIGQPRVTSGETATATATFSGDTSWPHADGITVQGNYHIHQPCCPSNDGVTCAPGGPPWTEDGFGTFSITFKSSSATVTGTAHTQDRYLLLDVNAIEFTASTDEHNTAVAVTINTITDPKLRDYWDSYANEAIRQPDTMKAILDHLRDVLNRESTRRDIAKVMNDTLKKIVEQHAAAIETERVAWRARSGAVGRRKGKPIGGGQG